MSLSLRFRAARISLFQIALLWSFVFAGASARADTLLSDIVGDGDGTGTAVPGVIGISPDDGLFQTVHINRLNNTGDFLQVVDNEVSPYIDSVFIMDAVPFPINSALVPFDFAPGDAVGTGWNYILKDLTHDIDKGPGDIFFGCERFTTAIGIHSSTGITFDLDAIRARVGDPAEVEYFTAFFGKDRCVGTINNYVIVSDGTDIYDFATAQFAGGANGGPVQLFIPPEAKFLTLATGAANNGDGCDHGVFANPKLSRAPKVEVVRDLPDAPAAGSVVEVTLTVAVLQPTTDLEIREPVPGAYIASDPSDNGVIEVSATGRQTVVWKLKNPTDQVLTYFIELPRPFPNACIKGSKVIADGGEFFVFGESTYSGGSDGFINEALVVTLQQPPTGGANPGLPAIRADYITDGDTVSEATVVPILGDGLAPDFLGASPSPGGTGATSLTWTKVSGPGWIELNTCDFCMAYVAVYATNPTDKTLSLTIGAGSDDSQQILVDGKEIWINNTARGNGAAQAQDHTPVFQLTPGKHLILQKVFEGGGGFNASLRFEDDDGNPYLLPLSLDPLAAPAYEAATAFVLRDVPDSLDVGESGVVALKLRVRDTTLQNGSIEETVPAGFAISNVTGGGQLDGQKITWTINGQLSNRDLSYRVAIPDGSLDGTFVGVTSLGGKAGSVIGDSGFSRGVMTGTGFIKHWLVLGPLDTFGLWAGDLNNPNGNPDGASATPENGDIRLDYITDGTLSEKTIRPFDGMRITPSFGLDGVTGAKAVSYEPFLRDCSPETSTWERYITPFGTLDNDTYFGGAVDSHATIAACYVTNVTATPLEANIAINSDDAFIAFLDGVEAVVYEPGPCSATACGRGYGGEDSVLETAKVTLPVGESFLLTRVHDGGGGSGHRLRFQDDAGNPVLNDKIRVSAVSTASPPEAYVQRTLSGDTYRIDGDPITVTMRVQVSGTHTVKIHDVLPAGWAAGAVSNNGVASATSVDWTLTNVTGNLNVTYQLVSGECPGGGRFCGNGASGSTYTVDGSKTHALNGDNAFKRLSSGTDDMGVWDARDIGTSGGGTQRVGDHAADALGKGGGIKASKDEFRFVSHAASGDYEISTQIRCLDDLGGSGQAGLMVRDTFDVYSSTLLFGLSSVAPAAGGVGTLKASFRRQTNKTGRVQPLSFADKDVVSLPIWLKIKRANNKLSLQRSSDGLAYTEVASRDVSDQTTNTTAIILRAEALYGLAVTGGGAATRADFREVSGPAFTPVVPNAPTLTTATGASKQVSLAWTAPATGPDPTDYVVARAAAVGGPYSDVAEVSAPQTSYIDAGLPDNTNYCYVVRSKVGQSSSADSNPLCAKTTGGGVQFRRGDADGNAAIELTDAISLLNYLFTGGTKPVCLDASDFDDNGEADISDAIANLNYQFLGGPAPAAPGPTACGADVGAETPELGCESGGC